MSKIFSTEFKINAKLIAIIYICYVYKFPLSFMLSFYEMYGDSSIFALKALTCSKKIHLTDTALIKIIEESRKLYNQILENISRMKTAKLFKQEYEPHINLDVFSNDYKAFIRDYLLENIEDIYAPVVKLRLSSDDLYRELLP